MKYISDEFSWEIFSGNEVDPINDNVDVHIRLKSGDKFYATFMTVENLIFLMKKFEGNGEFLNGLFFFMKDLIFVSKLESEVITRTISELIVTEQLAAACYRVMPDEDL